MKLKRNDLVKVLTGKDVGKTGVIEKIINRRQAIVRGLNLVKRHLKRSTKHPGGGIITVAAPIDLSNLKLVCPSCQQPTQVRIRIEAKPRHRFCRRCQQPITNPKST